MSQIKRLLIGIFLLLVLADASAQCPVANSCTPGSAPASAFPFGMGIYNVSVGSGATGIANTTTSGAPAGYQDFSCTQKATILEGVSTAITVATNPNSDENVRVWIDLNNNGTFEPATELVFSSNNARTHTGNFTIPISATIIKNQVLRLRVSSDDNGSPIPTPCSTPKFGQVEDYGITILPNLNKPATDFTVNKTITCSPTVQFTNLVQNNPTTYLWRFGDGTTSTQANPTKTYASPGVYTVTLISCNPMGCDSLVKTNYITYHTNVPVAASCTPATTNHCCGYGITKVTFHTLLNSSQNGSVGYEDFTCAKSVTVEENVAYPVALETGMNLNDAWIYIDYNNNGTFEASELAFSKLASFNPSGTILIQTGTVKNTPLRMRVIADAQGSPTGPCANRTSGQVEDYTITITANLRKPVAAFTSNFTNVCDSIIQFTSTSLYGPTSYLWDFGDGSSVSVLPNPQHEYQQTGSYPVKLKVCNASGCDSITKVNYIAYSKKCNTYCVLVLPSPPVNHTTNVTFNTINNSTGADPNGYGNYTTLSTTVVKGNNYVLRTSNTSTTWGWTTTIFIDYNQDGDFWDPGEKVVSASTNTVFISTIRIPVTAKTGITRMRVMSGSGPANACNYGNGFFETEDYSLNIVPNNQPPTARFTTFNPTSCSFTIAFADTSFNSATSRVWDFGDPATGVNNTSTLENPMHTFSGPGTYSIKLKACNNFGCDSLTKLNYITVAGNTGPQGITCKPALLNPTMSTTGILNVTFNTINHTTPGGDGYRDFTCSQKTSVIAGRSYQISIQNGVNTEDVRVWIDFDNDGQFNPVTELVLSSNFKQLHTGQISIPTSAVRNVPLRMRVSSEDDNWNGYVPTPCGNMLYGQVEDYTVTIVNPLGVDESTLAADLNIYPNPGSGIFSLEIPTVLKGDLQLEVQNLIGQKVAVKTINASGKTIPVDLSHLPKGLYLLQVSDGTYRAMKKILIE